MNVLTKPVTIELAAQCVGLTVAQLARRMGEKAGPMVCLRDAFDAFDSDPPVRDERGEERRMARMRYER